MTTLPTGYRLTTRQDVRTLWHDVSFEGDHWASFDNRTDAVAYCHEMTGPADNSLGSCGCSDYHYADCPTRGGM